MSRRGQVILAVLLCLLVAGVAYCEESDTAAQNATGEYGYISVDKNLIAVPGGLEAGDQVAFYNTEGEEIALQCVSRNDTTLTITDLPDGVYTVRVCRDDRIIDTQQVPIIGMEGR